MVKSRWVGISLGGPEERNQQMMFLSIMKWGGRVPFIPFSNPRFQSLDYMSAAISSIR